MLRAELLRGRSFCEALYYKDGEFLDDGSLLHFELSQVEDRGVGLLEWATPECGSAAEAAAVARAQEESLRAAIPAAEAALAERGYEGRVVVLKNNVDRRGNAYGSHESYDAWERARGPRAWLFLALIHPLVLAGLAAALLPLIAAAVVCAAAYGVAAGAAGVPGLTWIGRPAERALAAAGGYLVEVGAAPGSGAVARATVVLARILAFAFSWSGREVVLPGHRAALVPFLVTRPVVAGAGHLRPDGRFVLSPRAAITTRVAGAFVYGDTRPLIDLKEFFFARPLGFGRRRKRLQLLCGDATRADVATVVRLGSTRLVLDALEAGALDAVAGRVELLGGPVAAFQAVCGDPTLRAAVARDRGDGAALTALDVQRRYLEAVWRHAREVGADDEQAGVLQAWDRLLGDLARSPASAVGRVDWATKLELQREALAARFPEASPGDSWARLVRWGPVNAALEEAAPELDLPAGLPGARVAERLRAGLGRRRFARALRHVDQAELDWGELPAVRAAWLELTVLDLGYHALSRDRGAFEALRDAGEVAAILDPEAVARARREPPRGTRARLRGLAVRALAAEGRPRVRVGWERVQIGQGDARQEFHLDDPARAEHPELEAALAARGGGAPPG